MHKLKPLEPDHYGTGKWALSGRNLSPFDVENITKNGVDWDKDIMPDGRLKHPRFRLCSLRNNRPRTRRAVMNDATFEEEFSKWQEEWTALSQEERDEFGDFKVWFNKKYSFILARELLRNVLVSTRVQQSTKAAATFMEFSQSKPKSIVENLQAQPESIDLDKVIEIALAMKGISLDRFRKFIETETHEPAQA
jgi:hypothetical protein